MKEETAIEILEKSKNILDKNKVKFCLMWGTVLGAVREGRFIPGDSDIDLCVWKKDSEKIKEALKEFEREGFEIHKYGEKDLRMFYKDGRLGIEVIEKDNSYYYTVWYKPRNLIGRALDYLYFLVDLQEPFDSQIDKRISLFIMNSIRIIPGRILLSKFVWNLYKKYFSLIYKVKVPGVNRLKEIDFYGMKFRIPGNTREFLTKVYGENWRIPTSFDSFDDCGSIISISRYGDVV